jgi:hypothetical protein
MPPRYLGWAIVAFWLATSGWLFYREILPRFLDDQPTFFQPDYEDEVRVALTRWVVYQDSRKLGSATRPEDRVGSGTTQQQRQGHSFLLSSELKLNKLKVAACRLDTLITSAYEFGLERDLRGLDAKVVLREVAVTEASKGLADKALEAIRQWLPLEASMGGRVRGNEFIPRFELTVRKTQKVALPALDPVRLPAGGSFMNPMHPFDKIHGLSAGKGWRMPLVDPLADALAASLVKAFPPLQWALSNSDVQIRFLDARVRAARLSWEGGEQDCLVIEYTDPRWKNMVAQTWVRASDHRVLRQEAAFLNSRLVMERGPVGK